MFAKVRFSAVPAQRSALLRLISWPGRQPSFLMPQGQKDLPEEVAFDIEKDVNRTFPEVAK